MNQTELLEVVEDNRGIEFIERLVNCKFHPVLHNRNGTESSLELMYAEVDGDFIVYPTVVYDEEVMARLGPDTALGRALRVGDFVEFASLQEAFEFSKEYKRLKPFYESAKKPSLWKGIGDSGPGYDGDSMTGSVGGN